MSVLVLLELSVLPDKVEEARARFERILPDTRAYDGCEGVELFVDQDVPGKLLMVERWASRGQHEAYSAWRAGRTAEAAEGSALSSGEPRVIRYFDPLVV